MKFEHNLTLQSVETVATDTKIFRFNRPEELNFKAGQFLSIQFTATAARAYSIASSPDDDFIEFVIRIIPNGFGTQILDKAKPGDSFTMKGPFGMFVLSANEEDSLVFCGTGTGIAPLRSMIITEAKKDTPRPMKLLYGGRNAQDLAYLEEVATWTPNLEIYLGLSTDPEAKVPQNPELEKHAEHGRITQFLEDLDYEKSLEFYLCGNQAMVLGTQDFLKEKGVDPKKIFMERFT